MTAFEDAARAEAQRAARIAYASIITASGKRVAPDDQIAYRRGHEAGARWARDHLAAQEPSEAEVEAAAREVNARGWTCHYGAHEPGDFDRCADCRHVARAHARAILRAAAAERREAQA